MRIAKLFPYFKGNPELVFLVEDPLHLKYLTGLSLSMGSLLITKDSARLFVDGRYALYAKEMACGKMEVVNREKLVESLAAYAEIAIESKRMTVARERALLSEIQAKGAFSQFLPVEWVEQLRMCKEDGEILEIRRSIEMARGLWEKAATLLTPGITEKEVATFLKVEMAKLSARSTFEPIVAFGENGAYVHHHPSDRKLGDNEMALVDFGLAIGSYTSDITRLFSIGSPDPWLVQKKKELFVLVKELIALCTPGSYIQEIQALADNRVKELSLGEKMAHTFGHGVGMEVHEGPFVHALFPPGLSLKEGMVVTVEPGFYKEGVGGVRIEEMILVANPPIILTASIPGGVA